MRPSKLNGINIQDVTTHVLRMPLKPIKSWWYGTKPGHLTKKEASAQMLAFQFKSTKSNESRRRTGLVRRAHGHQVGPSEAEMPIHLAAA